MEVMRDQLTHAVEDYLKTIYLLTSECGRATTTQIANRLGVKPGSVTGMIQKMAATTPPLVDYQKHHGVVLTPQGEMVALEIIRHHRLLELFLHETLGYSWDEVHGEADRLEHVISEDFEERIAEVLGDPSHDPHGDPIPTRDFQMPLPSTLSLNELRPGQRALIQWVDSSDPELLRYLSSQGLVPQASVQVEDYSEYDGNLTLKVSGQEEAFVLGPRVTRQIYMEEPEPA
ncbi:MAG: metal-dependent transcriptional regulator [Anaerolineales bacterium]|jgi:DtxR family Mn-dependent transcriptional regulator